MRKIVKHPLCEEGGVLTAYLHDFDTAYIMRGPRPGILVMPGGGYRRLVEREADPVAFEFFSAGFNTFVLEYSVAEQENAAPLGLVPLMQASHALLTIRENAKKWNTAPDKLAVLGFSAGGHLAGACAVLWDAPELLARMDTRQGQNRPDAAVLCYPATLVGEKGHRVSLERLCGKEDTMLFDLPAHVKKDTPPMFLWTTQEDELVPCENTLEMAMRLQACGVPCELHVYTRGRHGLTLGKRETGQVQPHLASWVRLCKEWLGERFDFVPSI